MTHEESEAWKQKVIDATHYWEKLREARLRKGWSEEQVAAAIGMEAATYYDLEWFPGDMCSTCSLNRVLEICRVLDIHPRDLFCDQQASEVGASVPISELIDRIEKYCRRKNLSAEEFEDLVGWRIASCLQQPSLAVEEWDVDCLMDVCLEVDVDWRQVIVGL